MAELRVSELPTAGTLDDSDLLLLSQPDANSDTGYASAKTTNVALATKIAKNTSFGDLATTSKKLIGAINELKGEVGAQDLADLDDVNVTTPAAGECLQYNGTSQKWENKDILAVNETTLTEPYVYKQVPNGKYTEKLKKLIGASVVWNQLVYDGNFNSLAHWSSNGNISLDNHIVTVNQTRQYGGLITGSKIQFAPQHIILIKFSLKSYSAQELQIGYGDNVNFTRTKTFSVGTSWDNYYYLHKIPNTVSTLSDRIFVRSELSSDWIEYYVAKAQYFDITQMFGTTIADYVNTLETQTAGSGIAWLKSYGFFTEDYYAYSANTIQSVSVSKHITKDSDSQTLTETNLDHTTLRGIFKLDANNNLYADGDIYNADGSGSVKYGIIDLGTIAKANWTYYTSGDNPIFYTAIANSKTYTQGESVYTLCDKYVNYGIANSRTFISGSLPDKQTAYIYGQNAIFVIRDDSITSIDDLVIALDGVYLVYELATPTTATLTPFNPLSVIEQGGTEEFVDYGVEQGNRDVAIPPGNESAYGDNKLMAQIIKYINN